MIELAHLKRLYLEFKKNLLMMMINKDPLEILQSQIFQNWEKDVFNEILCTLPIKSYNSSPEHHFENKIAKYFVDQHTTIKVVERRPRSADKNYIDEKILRMQQQNNINLAIWSNIIFNNLNKQKETQIIYEKEQKSKQDFSKTKPGTEKGQKSHEKSLQVKQFQISTSNKKNNSENPLYNLLMNVKNKIKNSPRQTEIQFERLFNYLNEQNQKLIDHLKSVKSEQNQIRERMMQLGQRELSLLVRQKQLNKYNEIMRLQLSDQMENINIKKSILQTKQQELKKALGQKIKQFEEYRANSLNQMQINSKMNQLWTKVQLDQVRRNTLYELDKQNLSLKLNQWYDNPLHPQI